LAFTDIVSPRLANQASTTGASTCLDASAMSSMWIGAAAPTRAALTAIARSPIAELISAGSVPGSMASRYTITRTPSLRPVRSPCTSIQSPSADIAMIEVPSCATPPSQR